MSIGELYFSFECRIDRGTYWIGFIPPCITLLVCTYTPVPDLLALLLMIPALWGSFAINAKRCHDRNRTGFFQLLLLIPFIGIWPMIELGFLAGIDAGNGYGKKPG